MQSNQAGNRSWPLSVIALGRNTAGAPSIPFASDLLCRIFNSLARTASRTKERFRSNTGRLFTALGRIFVGPSSNTFASCQENKFLLQAKTSSSSAGFNALASLRQSVVDEQVGVKKVSLKIADEHEDVEERFFAEDLPPAYSGRE